jgi:hypothetical protein
LYPDSDGQVKTLSRETILGKKPFFSFDRSSIPKLKKVKNEPLGLFFCFFVVSEQDYSHALAQIIMVFEFCT